MTRMTWAIARGQADAPSGRALQAVIEELARRPRRLDLDHRVQVRRLGGPHGIGLVDPGRSHDVDPVGPVEEAARGYTQYGPLKTDTGEAVVALLEPIQARYRELIDDKPELTRMLRVGSDRARSVATKTLKRAYDAIGLIPA